MEHKVIQAEHMHVPHRWRFPDSDARIAATITSVSEVDKLALQINDGTYWRLVSVSPTRWQLAMGQSFDFDASGLLVNRGQYDNKKDGFSYLATDTGELYIRQGGAGEWSDPIPFGKGESGRDGENGKDGENGVGIPVGGLDGQILKKQGSADHAAAWGDERFTQADEEKLVGIASGATKNKADAVLLNRSNHNGTQSIDTVTGLDPLLTAIVHDVNENKENIAGLRTEFNDLNELVTVDIQTNISGIEDSIEALDNATDAMQNTLTSHQTQINNKAPLDSPEFTGAVSGVTQAMVGLSNVDNTSDENKPISIATQAALNGKLPQVTELPETNQGDVHLVGSGAYHWNDSQNKYVALTSPGSGKRVGVLEEFASRAHLEKEGATPRDGQLVPRALFPDFVRDYLDSGVLPTVTEAVWWATGDFRTSWVANDGNGNFRVADWNGKQTGSTAVYGGRGDGNKSNGVHGRIQFDQFQGHRFEFSVGQSQGTGEFMAGWSMAGDSRGQKQNRNLSAAPVSDGANGTPRVGDETHVTAPTVVWGVYLSNSTETTLSPAQIDELLGQYNALNSSLQTLNGKIDFKIIYPNGGTAAAPANVSLNSRYIMSNPFPNSFVQVVAQIQIGGKWGESGWQVDSSARGYGAKASMLDDEIVLRTGQMGVTSAGGANSGGSFVDQQGSYGTAPCRILVWKSKGAM